MTATTSEASATTRRPGRPRSAQAERAIHDATLLLLVEHGYERMSIEGVAARAGAGKATIYRRYRSKEELVAAALRSLTPDAVELPDTGSVRADLLALAEDLVRVTLGSVVGPMISRIVSASVSNPELKRIFLANVFDLRRALARQILERGVARGELRPDLDIDLVVDMIAGTLVTRLLFRDAPPQQLRATPPALVDTLLRGIVVETTE